MSDRWCPRLYAPGTWDEDVAGTPTTHYQLTVRIGDLMDQAVSSGVFNDEGASIAGSFDGTTEIDVGVDNDDLIRRIAYSLAMPEAVSGGAGGDIGVEFEFFDYDQPLDVEAPDPATVVTIDQYLQSAASAFVEAGDVLN